MQGGNHFPGADQIIDTALPANREALACEDLAPRLLRRRKSFVFGSQDVGPGPVGLENGSGKGST